MAAGTESGGRPTFDDLLAEAAAQPLEGWDFSYVEGRMAWSELPWSYEARVAALAAESPSMLDIETGGGELVAALPVRPPLTVATETWPPNVTTAARTLAPVGAHLVQSEPAPDNVLQAGDERRGALPFRPRSFELVVNRHGSYLAREVARVLAADGIFVTQQWGTPERDDLHDLLGLAQPPPGPAAWTLDFAVRQAREAGLRVVDGGEADRTCTIHDVGALAWWLRHIPWAVPGATVEELRSRLAELHDRICASGPVTIGARPFWFEAWRES